MLNRREPISISIKVNPPCGATDSRAGSASSSTLCKSVGISGPVFPGPSRWGGLGGLLHGLVLGSTVALTRTVFLAFLGHDKKLVAD